MLVIKKINDLFIQMSSSQKPQQFLTIVDISISYPSVFSTDFLKVHWNKNFPNGSFEAVFEKRIETPESLRSVTKIIRPSDMPKDVEAAIRLFDLAPFNHAICWHLISLINHRFDAFTNKLSSHCAAISTELTLWDNGVAPEWMLRTPEVQKLIDATEMRKKRMNEVNILEQKFQFNLAKKPALFALFMLPSSYEFPSDILKKNTSSLDSIVLCMDHGKPFGDSFGVAYLTNQQLACFREFLSQNELTELQQLLQRRISERQIHTEVQVKACRVDRSGLPKDTDHRSQNQFGAY